MPSSVKRSYYVYILTNAWHTTLYIGVTNNIKRRMQEHTSGAIEGFTKRYHLVELVYIEETNDVRLAIAREKQLKNWRRAWKIDLIRSVNPDFRDLAEEW